MAVYIVILHILYMTMRDYHMGFWLSPAVSTRDNIIRPESFSSRADNGRGLY